MTKNVEMKWDETKGNKNVFINPLSPSGDIWSPVWVLESVHTVLTQPGTLVSFRGMLFTCYSISGNSGISDVFHFRKTPELRRFRFLETPDSDIFRY